MSSGKEYWVKTFIDAVLLARTKSGAMRLDRATIREWHWIPRAVPDEYEIRLRLDVVPSPSPRLFSAARAVDFSIAADQLEELGWEGPALSLLRAAAAMSASGNAPEPGQEA